MNRNLTRTSTTGLLILVLSLFATAQAPAFKKKTTTDKPTTTASAAKTDSQSTLPTKAEVESFLAHMFGYNPNLKWSVGEIEKSEMPGVVRVVIVIGDQNSQLLVMPGGQFAIAGQYDTIPFGADPFAATRKKLDAGTRGPYRGTENPAITIVEFSDLQCPFCKQSQPVIDRLILEVPEARLVFQNFPLETIHKWAMKAAKYDDCVAQQSQAAFWKFVQGVFEVQSEINETNADEKLKQIAAASGADGDKTAVCASGPNAFVNVSRSIEFGKSLGINSTPTVFINGRKILNVRDTPFEQLKAIAEYEASQAKKK